MEKNRKTSEKKKETETIEVGPYNVNFFEMPKFVLDDKSEMVVEPISRESIESFSKENGLTSKQKKELLRKNGYE